MSKQMIIFDFDGTLIDTRADLTTAVNLMRKDYNLPALALETVTAFVGNGARKLVERALPHASLSIDEAIGRFKYHYSQHLLDETCLYEGVLEGLTQLREKDFALAIVTNKPEKPARQICDKLEISHFFDVILGGDSCPTLKPHPGPLLKALEIADCNTDESWMVGDNYTDMASGKSAGLKRCFCTYGFGHLRTESYELSVDNFGEFTKHILATAGSSD